jgi:solute:Na+ symporter, SSS family
MTSLDYAVLVAYAVGLLVIGGIFSRGIKDSAEMFAAGRRSPWWVSGMSGFMTIFSAGTFVVWGGIAFRLGAVAIAILVCSGGISTLLAAYLLAGRWRRLGVTTAAEYIRIRYGDAAVHFYTWLNLPYKIITMGIALYALSVILSALIPLKPENSFCDPKTGCLAVPWAAVLCGALVITYTVAGGLWAVLTNEVVQFTVLSLSVAVVVPLVLAKVGGLGGFLDSAPRGFLAPASGEYTWGFLVAWILINFFRHGGEWAYVQRFLCVPTANDARKSALLIATLFAVSPFLWMLPAMVYRVIVPAANPEQAYVLACRAVLPAGMIGMMLAAMFSATASNVSSELNVYAGVLTRDIYRGWLAPRTSERHLILVGRFSTVMIGLAVIGFALLVPRFGGAEKVVVTLVTVFAAAMVMPTIWGLFSRRANFTFVWLTVALSFAAAAAAEFGFKPGRSVVALESLPCSLGVWIAAHLSLAKALVGLVVPLLVLAALEGLTSRVSDGWERLSRATRDEAQEPMVTCSPVPARIVCWSLGLLGATVVAIAIPAAGQRYVLLVFGTLLLLLSAALGLLRRRGLSALGRNADPSVKA